METTEINNLYSLNEGETNNEGQKVISLIKTHYLYNGILNEFSEPISVKEWYYLDNKEKPTNEVINKEIELNDWSRWNTELKKGQKVEISEHIYWELMGAVPPRKMSNNYFEVGEAHHHENGKAIYRACWIDNDKYYTGYPKQ